MKIRHPKFLVKPFFILRLFSTIYYWHSNSLITITTVSNCFLKIAIELNYLQRRLICIPWHFKDSLVFTFSDFNLRMNFDYSAVHYNKWPPYMHVFYSFLSEVSETVPRYFTNNTTALIFKSRGFYPFCTQGKWNRENIPKLLRIIILK